MIKNLIMFADEAANTAAEAGAQQGQGSIWTMMVPLIVVILVMTFISGRSQKKQREKQQKMLDSMVKGSKIRTIGGFCGTIVEVGTETVKVELSDKMAPVELVKSAIAVVIDDKAEEKK